MRLLLLHTDYIEYKAEEKVGDIAEENVDLEGRIENGLAVFIAVESEDEKEIKEIVEEAKGEIEDVASQLKTDKIMLYPYAHLSDDLASPKGAVEILKNLEKSLKSDFKTKRAPFGWYKSFEVSCKGHPLAELSRQIDIEDLEPKKEESSQEKESEFIVLTPEGDEIDPLSFDGSKEFTSLIRDELGLETEYQGEPSHISLMQDKELVGYDSLTDPGNFRFYPKGKLIRDLLSEYVDSLILNYGGMPVETPLMYDLNSKPIREHSEKFGERQYRFPSGDKDMMLRFAACFGQFSALRDLYITSNDLPVRIYERAFSFRREQRGELSGLKRLRGFTMPDMHTACKNMEQAKNEFKRQLELAYSTSDDLGFKYVVVFRATEDFYNSERGWIQDIVDSINDPILVEILPERKHYWTCKIDFAVIDSTGEPIENPTVQIDVESAERFDIKYHDQDKEEYPILLHYSPTGSIERSFAALLEVASKQDSPMFPFWLSPSQVRLIPVGEEHIEFCQNLCSLIENRRFRSDIDDSDETVGRRIRRAEEEWIPYILVVGDDEIGDSKDEKDVELNVRVRGKGEEKMEFNELLDELESKADNMPKKPRYEPRFLSDRISFE